MKSRKFPSTTSGPSSHKIELRTGPRDHYSCLTRCNSPGKFGGMQLPNSLLNLYEDCVKKNIRKINEQKKQFRTSDSSEYQHAISFRLLACICHAVHDSNPPAARHPVTLLLRGTNRLIIIIITMHIGNGSVGTLPTNAP